MPENPPSQQKTYFSKKPFTSITTGDEARARFFEERAAQQRCALDLAAGRYRSQPPADHERIALQLREHLRLIQALEMLAELHRKHWVPTALFGLTSPRQVEYLAEHEALGAEARKLMKRAITWVSPPERGYAQMRAAAEAISLHVLPPLPESLLKAQEKPETLRAPAPRPAPQKAAEAASRAQGEPAMDYEAWLQSVDVALFEGAQVALCCLPGIEAYEPEIRIVHGKGTDPEAAALGLLQLVGLDDAVPFTSLPPSVRDFRTLAFVPSGDVNFKAALERADSRTVETVIRLLDGKTGHVTRMRALRRRFKKLTPKEREPVAEDRGAQVRPPTIPADRSGSTSYRKEAIQAAQAKAASNPFLAWLGEVNRCLYAQRRVTTSALLDVVWRRPYREGLAPDVAAQEAVTALRRDLQDDLVDEYVLARIDALHAAATLPVDDGYAEAIRGIDRCLLVEALLYYEGQDQMRRWRAIERELARRDAQARRASEPAPKEANAQGSEGDKQSDRRGSVRDESRGDMVPQAA